MEKRQHKREKLVYPLEVTFGKENHRVVTLNVSARGLGVLSDHTLPTGPCRVHLDNQSLPGKVVYEKEDGRGKLSTDQDFYQYGIRLDNELNDNFRRLLAAKATLRGQEKD